MEGLGKTMPFTFGAFAIASLSMIGAPPVAGFVTKWNLLVGSIQAHQIGILLILIASTMLNVAYFAPVTYQGLFRQTSGRRTLYRYQRGSIVHADSHSDRMYSLSHPWYLSQHHDAICKGGDRMIVNLIDYLKETVTPGDSLLLYRDRSGCNLESDGGYASCPYLGRKGNSRILGALRLLRLHQSSSSLHDGSARAALRSGRITMTISFIHPSLIMILGALHSALFQGTVPQTVSCSCSAAGLS